MDEAYSDDNERIARIVNTFLDTLEKAHTDSDTQAAYKEFFTHANTLQRQALAYELDRMHMAALSAAILTEASMFVYAAEHDYHNAIGFELEEKRRARARNIDFEMTEAERAATEDAAQQECRTAERHLRYADDAQRNFNYFNGIAVADYVRAAHINALRKALWAS